VTNEQVERPESPSGDAGPVARTAPDLSSPMEGEVLGLECRHHYGITAHPLTSDETPAALAYRLTRGWHPAREGGYGLTDDNHAWEVVTSERPEWFSRIRIVKNEKSPPFLAIPGIRVPGWLDDGPGATWFAQDFRIATIPMLEAEVAELVTRKASYAAKAAQQRDTVRGRKAAKRFRSLASEMARQVRSIDRRWPQIAIPEGAGDWGEHGQGPMSAQGADGEAGSTGNSSNPSQPHQDQPL